jgi:hypothetical protein
VIAQQAAALLRLRATLLWRMTWSQGRGLGRLLLVSVSFGAGLFFSGAIAFAVWEWTEALGFDPHGLAARGGSSVVFATALTSVLLGRLWFAFLPRGQTAPPFDPRRFLVFAVPASLVSTLNFVAQLLDPAWLFFWPILVALAIGCAGLPGMPGAGTLLAASALAVWAIAGVLQLFGSFAAALDARSPLRRTMQVLLFLAAFAGLQLAVARPGRSAAIGLFASRHWDVVRWTPPGWAASFVASVANARLWPAFGFGALLFAVGVVAAVLAHALSLREARRPVETGTASATAARGRGWAIPGLADPVSALVEKEAKTIVRVGWLQLVVIPVGYLLLRSVFFAGDAPRVLGRAPILFAAVYAHLGVIEFATNVFGRDLSAARAWFLWPVSARAVLAAKNAVAYAFSLVIFAVLVGVAIATGPVQAEEIAVGALAHLAIYPVLATLGNVASILWPVPVRGMRFRRVRGSGPIGARFVALAALGAAAWIPTGIAHLVGLPLAVAYAGELVALGAAYGGLLALAAHLFESKRDPLLAALARDE